MSYLKSIIYNCNKATYLIEKRQLDQITLKEGIELRIHFLGCYFCRLYNRQSKMINGMLKALFEEPVNLNNKTYDRFKQELRTRIEEELNKN